MSEKNLTQALRAAMAREIVTAPRQHRLRTSQCPPLTRFTLSARWAEDEKAHMAGCAYCQMILRRLREGESGEPNPADLRAWIAGLGSQDQPSSSCRPE